MSFLLREGSDESEAKITKEQYQVLCNLCYVLNDSGKSHKDVELASRQVIQMFRGTIQNLYLL
jgi:hypothetical protein